MYIYTPSSQDFETVIALNVLFQYLQDTSASPFYQAFVEREFPIASDVDYDAKNFVETGLCLYFSGVPFRQDGGGDGGEEDEDVSMSEADEKNNDDTSSIESEEDG